MRLTAYPSGPKGEYESWRLRKVSILGVSAHPCSLNLGDLPQTTGLPRGDENVIAYGTKDMPVWGPIFRNTGPSRNLADLRVANLVDYIRTIQEK